MATATATATATAPKPVIKPANPKDTVYEVQYIDLHKISANSAQSRGTGALSNLQALGWGLFKRIEAEKTPIWSLLMSDDAAERQQAQALIQESEGAILTIATSLALHGQEQPSAVVKLKDGTYDVLWGMQRAIARAYNWIVGQQAQKPGWMSDDEWKAVKGSPCTVRAEIHPESDLKDALQAKIKSRAENRARKAENPIDVALYYQELKTEHKLNAKQIALLDDCSEQQVKDRFKLLDDSMMDKRTAIMAGEMSVQKALDLYNRRKEGTKQTEKDPNDSRERGRFPSVKVITKAFGSGIKPKKFDDELWELFKLDDVRKFIAKSLGFKFQPYKAPSKKAIAEAEGTNGSAKTDGKAPAAAAAKKPGKTFGVPRSTADKLLIELGMTNARTFAVATVVEKLENIVALGESGTKLEDKGAQNLFDKLHAAYKDGYKVVIK